MNTSDLSFFKAFLLSQKSFILNKAHEFKRNTLTHHDRLGDEADVATQNSSISLFINLHERDRNSLVQIENALSKIDSGTYGQCESCADFIEVKRLRARPFATLCIHCMEEHEDPPFGLS